jgi:hypothetical protein
MKTLLNTVAVALLFTGLIMMAGSAGDCDGACGPGNTIGEMIMIALLGLAAFGSGAAILISNQGEA